VSDQRLSREEKAIVLRARDKEGNLIGQLRISTGGLRWYPKNSKKHHFARWEKFAELMERELPKVV
jgi:hypothetical protein